MGTGVRKQYLPRVFVAVALVVFGIGAVHSAGAARSVRGFDGKTVTVAGYGVKSQLPTIETAAAARFKRFNDTNELKGVTINFSEFADDGQDPATTLSIERRLVTQTQVFAVVPNMSASNNASYLAEQHVPSFGGGFDTSYCSPKASTTVWAFSPGGCIVPATPSFVSDLFKVRYDLVSKATGKKHPTFVIVLNDNATSQNGARIFSQAAKGAGFKVVGALATVPVEVTDYTPYVTQLMTADDGKPPDTINCSMQAQCLNIYSLLQANGYKGAVFTSLYTDFLAKAMQGSYSALNFGPISGTPPAMVQMKKDLDAYRAGASAKVDLGSVYGYTSADMFIQALKQVAKKGTSNITPENVQKFASTMTWEMKGVMGPIQYPKSTVMTFPACYSAVYSDGTTWKTVEPFGCSTRTFAPPSAK